MKRARDEGEGEAAPPPQPFAAWPNLSAPKGAGFAAALAHLPLLPPAPGSLLLVSFNVQSLSTFLAAPEATRFLKLLDPHLLCLQEVKRPTAQAVQSDMRSTLFKLAKDPQSQLSVLSASLRAGATAAVGHKHNLGTATLGSVSSPGHSALLRAVARVRLDLPPALCGAAGLTLDEGCTRAVTLWVGAPYFFCLVNVYQPNSGDDRQNVDKRTRWDRACLAYVKALQQGDAAALVWTNTASTMFAPPPAAAAAAAAAAPFDYTPYAGRLILCGDLNVIHSQELDIHVAKGRHVAGCTAQERSGLDALLREGGLHDVWRQRSPGLRGFTFFMDNWRGVGPLAARFDAFLVSSALLGNVVDCGVLERCPRGDHLPLYLRLRFEGGGAGSSEAGGGGGGSGGSSSEAAGSGGGGSGGGGEDGGGSSSSSSSSSSNSSSS